MRYWLKKWLFAFSLSVGLLIPFSLWAIKTLWWSVYQQPWDLPIDAYTVLTIMTFVLLLMALVSIIIQPVPKQSRGKLQFCALLFTTLACNVGCWWIVWIIAGPGFS